MRKIKEFAKKITPIFIMDFYHFLWAFLSAVFYRFPSNKIKVIGITGTKGKSSAVFMAGKILENAGHKVAWSSSLGFKIGQKEKINPYHITMPGRGIIQKMIRKAVNEKCDYFLLETTSEGIKQNRHKFINFDTAVFTNLRPEHIEAHGGFENYKKTKKLLFTSPKKEKTIIVNLDDENADFYLDAPAKRKIGFSLNPSKIDSSAEKIIKPSQEAKFYKDKTEFIFNETKITLNLPGKFNLSNALSAIAIADSCGVSKEIIKSGLGKINKIEGRMEKIDAGQKFKIFVDLAHTPDSFLAVFETVKFMRDGGTKIISVFGSAGGGRDKWKRPKLGKIASDYSDAVILTNEDSSYGENPEEIINQIADGINNKKAEVFKITNRREAIKKGLELAQNNDTVLFLGKGTETTYSIAGKIYPWDERAVVKEELLKIINLNNLKD